MMKFAAFACLLFVAGISALPEPDVEPTQGRIVDLYIRNRIDQFQRWAWDRNLDPLNIESREFSTSIIDGLVAVAGSVQGLTVKGITGIDIKTLIFNIFFGTLEFDIDMKELNLSVEKLEGVGIYGGLVVNVEISGSLVIEHICLKGHALLRMDPNFVYIVTLFTDASIGKFKSDLEVYVNGDRSSGVNEFINETIPNFLQANRVIINVWLADWIQRGVNWWWW